MKLKTWQWVLEVCFCDFMNRCVTEEYITSWANLFVFFIGKEQSNMAALWVKEYFYGEKKHRTLEMCRLTNCLFSTLSGEQL